MMAGAPRDSGRVHVDFPEWLGIQTLAQPQHLSPRLLMPAVPHLEPSCCSKERFPEKASGRGSYLQLGIRSLSE